MMVIYDNVQSIKKEAAVGSVLKNPSRRSGVRKNSWASCIEWRRCFCKNSSTVLAYK